MTRPVPGSAVDGAGGPTVPVSRAPVEGSLSELRDQARLLVAEVAGPLRRIYVRRGDAVLEVEWHAGTGPDEAEPATGRPASAAGSTGSVGDGGPAAGPGPAGDPPDGPRLVVSPMVGTFYRASEPGAPPFVEVGDVVEPDRVVGIVEAMKLMNEITAGQPGRVVDLLVSDGQPVEFGQPLIALAPL